MDNHQSSVFTQDEKTVQNSRDTSESPRWNELAAGRTDFDDARRDFSGENCEKFPGEPSHAVYALVLGLAEAGMTANKVELGKYLVKEYGWVETLFKFDELSPSLADWLATLSQGPTPGGYVAMMSLREWLEQLLNPCK